MKKFVADFLGLFNRTNMAIFGYLLSAFWIWILYPLNWMTGFFSGFFFGMFVMRIITKLKEWIESADY